MWSSIYVAQKDSSCCMPICWHTLEKAPEAGARSYCWSGLTLVLTSRYAPTNAIVMYKTWTNCAQCNIWRFIFSGVILGITNSFKDSQVEWDVPKEFLSLLRILKSAGILVLFPLTTMYFFNEEYSTSKPLK